MLRTLNICALIEQSLAKSTTDLNIEFRPELLSGFLFVSNTKFLSFDETSLKIKAQHLTDSFILQHRGVIYDDNFELTLIFVWKIDVDFIARCILIKTYRLEYRYRTIF